MMSFKDALRSDLSVFINEDEFANEHIINGQKVSAIVDSSIHNTYGNAQLTGVIQGIVTVYVKRGALSYLPKCGEEIKLDGKRYHLIEKAIEQGLNILTLEAFTQ